MRLLAALLTLTPVVACASHPVLSGPALDRIKDSVLDELVVTNSIPLSDKAKTISKIKVLSVAPLLGEAIKRIHRNESVSRLFD